MYYPLFLNITAVTCLIVGAGSVGLRKAKGVLCANPRYLLVLDNKSFGPEWEELRHPALRCEVRAFCPDDIDNCGLVFACTGDRDTNATIARACVVKGIWCNCADAPLEGNCIVPSVARKGDMVAALSTGGSSPALARVLREELENWIAPTAPLARLLGRLRPHILAMQKDTTYNSALFRTLARSAALRRAIADNDTPHCTIILCEYLPDALHPILPELLHELF